MKKFIANIIRTTITYSKFLLMIIALSSSGTVAKADDAYASYYNPAGLGFLKGKEAAGMHVNWLKTLVPDLYYEYLGFSIPMGEIGGFGGHLIFLSLGEQTATNEVGDYLGSFSSYMYALDASYGTKLTNNSAIGLGFKIYHQKNDGNYTEWNYNVSTGEIL